MSPPIDWLSRLLDLGPVRGHLDLRCFHDASWPIDQDRAAAGESPHHVVLGGSAVLEDAAGGPPTCLVAGDILLLPNGSAHILRGGSGSPMDVLDLLAECAVKPHRPHEIDHHLLGIEVEPDKSFHRCDQLHHHAQHRSQWPARHGQARSRIS